MYIFTCTHTYIHTHSQSMKTDGYFFLIKEGDQRGGKREDKDMEVNVSKEQWIYL